MFRLQTRPYWMVFVLVLCTKSFVGAEDGILSTAYGLRALHWIKRDAQLREKLSISDTQLSDVQRALNDRKLIVGDAKDESTGRSYVKKILTKDQLDRLRVEVVKTRIVRPQVIFSYGLLSEFGLTDEEITRILDAFWLERTKISERADKLRIEAIKTALPPDAQDVLWKFVGKEFTVDGKGTDIKEMEVFGVSPFVQISQATYAPVPMQLRFSAEQRERIRKISDEIRLKTARGIVCTREEVEIELDAILTTAQRVATIQALNLMIVQQDLPIVVNSKISKLYNLSDEHLAEAKAELTQRKNFIEELEFSQVVLACSEMLKRNEVRLNVRNEIKELVAGVWSF